MNYNFDIFLITLFIFYAFLFLLMLFYYIPFSTKPEHLFLLMKKRFFKLAQILLQRNRKLEDKNGSFMGAMTIKYSKIHLMSTVKKMQLWASQIDDKYFETLDKKLLLDFTKECETFVYLLQMMYHRDIQMLNNPLLILFRKQLNGNSMINILGEYAKGKDAKELNAFWIDEKKVISKTENHLKNFISTLKSNEYSEEEIIEFYEYISLRRNVWLSILSCQMMMQKLDFKVLQRSRF